MRLLAAICLAGLTGCTSATKVVTDVRVVEKPVPVRCSIDWPKAPIPHVALVQTTGDALKDLLLIARAMEAELGERIAYEVKLDAAARACVDSR